MDFVLKSIEKHGNKYNYSKVDYVNNKTKVVIICPLHGDFNVRPAHHIFMKIGCPKCSGSHKRTTQEFIGEANKIHNGFYDYSLVNFENVNKKVTIICPKHGQFKQRPQHHLSEHGCPSCNESKGEKYINKYLVDNNIKFVREKTFDDCKSPKNRKLRFDFWLPNNNTCIEFDGPQHHNATSHYGLKSFDDIKINDKIKNEYCQVNKIKLIRILYEQYKQEEKIINILKQNLNETPILGI